MRKFDNRPVNILRFLLCSLILLCTACSPVTPTVDFKPIRVQYSFAAQPWLAKLDVCAGKNVLATELRPADFQDPGSTDLILRYGLPIGLTANAYQIGTDDLLVIVNRQNPLVKLTLQQVQALFTGQIQDWNSIQGTDAPVKVWVFPNGEDVQQVFEKSVLGGRPITSLARLANNPEEMSRAVSNDAGAVGIITQRWKILNTSDVFTAASHLPILAFTQSKPQGVLAQILACMQN